MLPVLPGGFVSTGNAQTITASNGLVVARATPMQWVGSVPDIKPVNISFQNGVDLVGYTAGMLKAGSPLDITLYWQPHYQIKNDAHLIVQLWDAKGNALGAVHNWPFNGTYRLGAWQTGQAVPMNFRFNLGEDITPGAYRLMVGWFDLNSQTYVLTQSGEELVPVARLKSPMLPVAFDPNTLISATFGNAIRLNGYSVEDVPGNLSLALQWEALSQPQADYTRFTHIVNEAGEIVAQADSQPVQNTYPTGIWSEGEVVLDSYDIPVPSGQYDVYIGLYQLDTGERLPILVNGQEVPEARLLLQHIEVP
jgi:hypothetical protein